MLGFRGGHLLSRDGHLCLGCCAKTPSSCRPVVWTDPFDTPTIHQSWRYYFPDVPNLSHVAGQFRINGGGGVFCVSTRPTDELQLADPIVPKPYEYRQTVRITPGVGSTARKIYLEIDASDDSVPGVIYPLYQTVSIDLDAGTTRAISSGYVTDHATATWSTSDPYHLHLWVTARQSDFFPYPYQYLCGLYCVRGSTVLHSVVGLTSLSHWPVQLPVRIRIDDAVSGRVLYMHQADGYEAFA